MIYLIILIGVFYLYSKYTTTQKSNAAFERVSKFLDDDGYRKFEGTQKELELFEQFDKLMNLNREGIISDEELDSKLEIIKRKKVLLDEQYPERLTNDEYEQAIRDGQVIGSVMDRL